MSYFDDVQRLQRELAKAVQPTTKQLQKALRELSASLAPRIAAHEEAMGRVSERLAASYERIAPKLVIPESVLAATQEAMAAIQRSWEGAFPANLRELQDANLIWGAFKATSESAPCMIWAPRAEIVEQLLAVGTFADRADVLVARRADVLADVEGLIHESSGVLSGKRAEFHRFARRAVEAASAGHDEAAQALAGAALGLLVHEIFGHRWWKRARASLAKRQLEDALLSQARYYALSGATVQAITDTREGVEGFNRHGTVHGEVLFYGEAEMLAGLLLIVAWTRELAWWAEREAEGDPDTT